MADASLTIDGVEVLKKTSGEINLTNTNFVPNSSFMFRNKIINGDMRIDQRNSGNQSASNAAGGGYYGPDRFQLESDQAGKFNVQQNKGSQTPPNTFTKYYGVESLSAYSTGASNYALVSHHIEGQNISDLKFGTAEAKTITLSFWVRSNVSGTNNVYVGSLRNATYNRSFVFTYTINLPNVWEYKTITIPGDTSGTWATDNTAGIRIGWDLGSGSNYQTSTTNAWLATNAFATASSTKMCATSGATLFLTGVQLEIGTISTPFEHRPIGMELSLCQRYFEKVNYSVGAVAGATLNRATRFPFRFAVDKRATPDVIISSSSNTRCNTPTASEIYTTSVTLRATNNNTDNDDYSAQGSFTAEIEL